MSKNFQIFIWCTMMIVCFSLPLSAATETFQSLPYQAATENYLVNKSDDGSILTLADGSVWQVSEVDKKNSVLWLPNEIIIVPSCEDYLYNKDHQEKVDVQRVK